jgi:hypothetical protein
MITSSSWGSGKYGQYLRLAIYAWGLIYCLRLFDLQFILGDEGVALVNGWRIALGQVPVRDFFEIIPPFSFMPTAAAFALFGPTLVAARVLTLIYGLLLMLSMDALVGTVAKDLRFRTVAVLLAVPLGVFYYPMPSHHWVVNLLQVWALLALFEGVRRSNHWAWGLLAGALSALAVFTLQDQGSYFVLALCLFFFPWINNRASMRRVFFAWMAGGVGILSAFAIYLLPRVSLERIWYQWYTFPRQNYGKIAENTGTFFRGWGWRELISSWNGNVFAIHPFQTCGLFILLGFVSLLPFLGLLSALTALKDREIRWKAGGLMAGLLAAYGTCLHRWALLNLVWAAPFALVLALFALLRATGAKNPVLCQRSAWAMLALLSAAALAFSATHFVLASSYQTFPVVTPAGTWRTQNPNHAHSVQGAVDAVLAIVPGDGKLLCIGFTPLFNFMTQRPCPTQWNYYLFGYNTEAQARATITAVQGPPSAYVCMVKRYLAEAGGDAFGRYLLANYSIVWQNEEFLLLAPTTTQGKRRANNQP